MIPLKTAQLFLTWFGLLQDENSTFLEKFAYALFSLINLVLIFIQIAASAVSAIEFLMIDLERALYATSQVLIYSSIMYMLLATLLWRGRITALIEEVTTIFNSSMYSLHVSNECYSSKSHDPLLSISFCTVHIVEIEKNNLQIERIFTYKIINSR